MRMIRDHTSVVVGLIAPIKFARGTVNAGIEKHAHWTRRHIRDEEFADSQLPHMVRCGNGVIHKPITWYPRRICSHRSMKKPNESSEALALHVSG